MDDKAVNDIPFPRLWSKRKILTVAFGVPALMIIGVLIFLGTYDEKLQPFEDLTKEIKPMPGPELNGFAFLLSRWSGLPDISYQARNSWRGFEAGTAPWQDDFVDLFNPRHQDYEKELSEALALSRWEDPGLLVLGGERAGAPRAWGTEVIRSLKAEAWMKARRGDLESAVSLIEDVRRMARRQIQGSGDAEAVRLGLVWDGSVTEFTCRIVSDFQPNDSLLARLSGIWALDPIFPEDLIRPLQGSCVQFRHQFDDEEKMSEFPWLARVFLLKRNKALNLLHREMRKLMADGLRTGPNGLTYVSDYFWENDWRPGLRTADNLVGIRMVRDDMWFTGYQLSDLPREQLFRTRALRIWLAIRRWRLLHPDQKLLSFAELPGDFLQSVPVDPWDGHPLRWRAADEVIAGVGSDWKGDPAAFGRIRSWFYPDSASPALRLPPLPPPSAKPPKPIP